MCRAAGNNPSPSVRQFPSALLPTFLNRLAALRLEVEEERLEEFLIKEVTRMVPISGRVATI
jgi:hypothetical protein